MEQRLPPRSLVKLCLEIRLQDISQHLKMNDLKCCSIVLAR